MSEKSFVHLHNHTHYSLLDGLAKPADYFERAKELNMPAVAITDHGVCYGLLDFYQTGQKYGVKPILGVEVYVSPRTRHNKDAGVDNKPHHLVLLAKNYNGYKNLLKLTTIAHTEGYYYKPRIDWEVLREYGNNLIGMTACLQGHLAQQMLRNEEKEAKETVEKFKNIFGEDSFYLELQHHPEIADQEIANKKLIEFAKNTSTPLVATNDCHYAKPEDQEAHDVLICIQTNAMVEEDQRMKYTGDFSFKSAEEMRSAFKDVPEACDNTLKIAEMCNTEIPLGRSLLPSYPPPKESKAKNEKQYLEEQAYKGFEERYGFSPVKKDQTDEEKEKSARLAYELGVVDQMGFNAYFLIVQDFVMYAKNNEILVGPGRGSAAGSILSYALKITDIDPLPFGLIFERFLNPARVSMPDIDIDFADDRRDEVLEYVREKYGNENVAQIITFGTMAAKAAVKDVARVFGIPFAESNKLTDMIPSKPGTKLQEALNSEPELKKAYATNATYKKVIDIALKIEGTIRHAGVHACAVVISEKALTEYTALQYPPGNKSEELITQYSMHPIEDIGLLKMDFLGLKNLTLLQKTMKIVKRTRGKEYTVATIPDGDEKAYELLQSGDTTGVFQLESAGMKRYLKKLKPENLEDIIAMVSLYRPGPMEWIPSYIDGKHGKRKVKYLHDDLKEILEVTYGVAVYQEQTMQIAQKFAGFTMAEADILRKAIGKKKPELLAEQKQKFIEGAEKKGYQAKLAKQIFEKVIEPFAGYGFNKSHAACYAKIAYLTAYLKSHYPAEFMAALMTADQNDSDRIAIEFDEAERMGIEVLPPDVNESFKNFTVTSDGNIRFGLLAIKGIGAAIVEEITKERDENGHFESIEDMLKRLPIKAVNKKTIEALIFSGALDNLGERGQLIENLELMLAYARDADKTANSDQQDIFSLMSEEDMVAAHKLELKKTPEATIMQKLKWEKEYLGMYITAHPLDGLKKYLSKKYHLIEKLEPKMKGKEVIVGGLVTGIRKMMTKKGESMLFAKIEDPTGEIGVIMFPSIYAQLYNALVEDQFAAVKGKFDLRGGEKQIIVTDAKKVSLEAVQNNAKETGMFREDEKISKYKKEEKPEEKEVKEEEDEKQDKEEKKPAEPGVIKINIPEGTPKFKLHHLQEIFLKNPGDAQVILKLKAGENIQEVTLPVKVKVTPEIKAEIKKII